MQKFRMCFIREVLTESSWHNQRDKPDEEPGGDVRFSNDSGLTWSAPLGVLDCGGDLGYPSSVQRSDGQIVTAYYASKIGGHRDYHMGIVIR